MRVKKLAIVSLIVFCLVVSAWSQEKSLSPALSSLVEAERSFAKLAGEIGVRDSFIAYFADDGINFLPHPTNTREAFRKRPVPTGKPQSVLKWAPIYGDVSQAGDLGYSTGPSVVEPLGENKRPPSHGLFFSVWKKQVDGNWRVAVDLGIQLDAPFAPLDAPYQPARQWKAKALKSNLDDERAQLARLDQDGFAYPSSATGFLNLLSEDARIYRDNLKPLIGRKAIDEWLQDYSRKLAGEPNLVKIQPIKADVASSNDLGYSYGSYEMAPRHAPQTAALRGYYVRAWKRDEKGSWRIVFDIVTELPAEKK